MAPLRRRGPDEFGLADWGIELEIQRYQEEAAGSLSDSSACQLPPSTAAYSSKSNSNGPISASGVSGGS